MKSFCSLSIMIIIIMIFIACQTDVSTQSDKDLAEINEIAQAYQQAAI